MTVQLTADDRWSLVLQRVSKNTIELWIGTLFDDLTKPKQARVRVHTKAGNKQVGEKLISDWKRPFSTMDKRFYQDLCVDSLRPNTVYTVIAEQHNPDFLSYAEFDEGWQTIARGEFKTLPASLPTAQDAPFTVALGSCFYHDRDGGAVGAAYEALYNRGLERWRPDVSFLTGDQVYLDIGGDSLSPHPDEVVQRLGDAYAHNWRLLRELLRRGGTWMLPDDHELWNGYPEVDALNPLLWRLQNDKIYDAWKRTALDGIERVQRTKTVERFDIGKDLSFCIADFRSRRTEHRFIPDQDFDEVVAWAKALTCPGVLVACQPLIVNKNNAEANLLSYQRQYGELLLTLGSSGHDIVLMSGDVHFGRIAGTALGGRGGFLYEVIASPMSNLTGIIAGRATATPKKTPRLFPLKKIAKSINWPQQRVSYYRTVNTRPAHGIFSTYPKARTREHFLTIGFSKPGAGKKVRMEAQAWRVRETGRQALPVKDFTSSFVRELG